jgi:hypothetical protein
MRSFCRWLASSFGAACFVALVGAIAASGCTKAPVKLYPVRGQVFYKDKPAEGAQVILRPQGEPLAEGVEEEKAKPPPAYGTVGTDGTFTLHTEFGEGAAAGDYAAFVTWIGVDPNDAEQRISKLPPKYADQEKPVLKVSVKEQKNELEPFRLK